MRWFGKDWMPTMALFSSSVFRMIVASLEMPAPKNATCLHCKEPIVHTDSGMEYPDGGYAHKNCHMRQIIGPVAHIEKKCGCYVPGSTEGDPAGMTDREAADAAVAAWERKMKQRVN
jgi:hypothetical protein